MCFALSQRFLDSNFGPHPNKKGQILSENNGEYPFGSLTIRCMVKMFSLLSFLKGKLGKETGVNSANSCHQFTFNEKGDKNKNGTFVFPENVPSYSRSS